VDRRARWLYLHPLCCECEKEGRVTAADVVDHDTPLWKGGADDYETNGRSLCNPHHDAKTAKEAAERAAGG
jgi:5-methylcytosine-specific restriction protein A